MKKKKDKSIQEVKPPQTPRSELQDKLRAIKALALVYELLCKGMHPVGSSDAIKQSLEFIKSLHTQILDDASKDQDAHLVPELVQHAKGASNE